MPNSLGSYHYVAAGDGVLTALSILFRRLRQLDSAHALYPVHANFLAYSAAAAPGVHPAPEAKRHVLDATAAYFGARADASDDDDATIPLRHAWNTYQRYHRSGAGDRV